MSQRPGIVHIAPEMAPYASTGGLAQVVAALPPELARRGCPVTVVLPRHGAVDVDELEATEVTLEIRLGPTRHVGRLLRDPRREDHRVLFLDIPSLYDRPGLYGTDGEDYPDNAARFIALCRGALEAVRTLRLPHDVLHVHDWQSALVPVYLAAELDEDPFWRDSRSVLTIHNLAYQGQFWHLDMPLTGLPWSLYTPRVLEYWNEINFLKGGIVTADAITTVSPRYAEEILEPEYGFGLEGVLRERRDDLHGILNGIDTEAWDPGTDPRLASRYSADRIQGKGKCKRALLRDLGLEDEPDRPLLGMVARLVEQKGVDLVLDALPRLMRREDFGLVVRVAVTLASRRGSATPPGAGRAASPPGSASTRISPVGSSRAPTSSCYRRGSNRAAWPRCTPCGTAAFPSPPPWAGSPTPSSTSTGTTRRETAS